MHKIMTALLLGMATASQAGDLDRFLKDVLKAQQQATQPQPAQQQTLATPPQNAPAQPAQPAAPAQPVPPAAPAASPKPADQLLRALVAGNMSVEQERSLGGQIAGNLLGAVPLVKDDALQQYVNRVGRWVAMQGERPDLPWRFGVVDSEDINAFAAPGGYVLVTRGLYRKLSSEAELAGVLAHEIGHVIRKHHLKLLQQSQLVAAVGGLLGSKVKGGQTVQNIIGNGAEIVARSLDKEAEFEADRVGVVLAARAGYDAYGLPAVLQEIGHVPDRDSRMALLYKTHPHPDDRLQRLSEAVGDRFDGLPEGRQLPARLRPLPR